MPRLTLYDIKNDSRIPAALGVCPDDARLVQWINEATQRLLAEGTWWGTHARYRVSVSNGLLVWPRQFAAILAGSVAYSPIKLRDEWFEFIENAYGIRDGTENSTGEYTMFDRGNTCLFSQITGDDKQIKVYADVAEAGTAEILLLGYDENGNWIRTQSGGVWYDGERVGINSVTPQTSSHIFTAITDVQKPTTNGTVRLYAIDPSLVQTAIAIYAYDEMRPSYRVSYIPALDDTSSSSETVEVVAKLDFIPVRNDTDYVLIGNIAALKDMACAVKTAEQDPTMAGKAQAIAAGLGLAKSSLNAELTHYGGQPRRVMPVDGTSGPTMEPMETFI